MEQKILRRPYTNQRKRDLELCEAYQKGILDERKLWKKIKMKEFKPCKKHLGLEVFCGGYSKFVEKIVYCSVCSQKKEDSK